MNAAWSNGQTQARTLVPLLGNFLRVTLAILALLVALSQFGYQVTSLLAGLGIGGIAVALAGQKTVEHLFGSVSLAADKAFRVGDFVRVGTLQGTVERIGLRSTSFRTIDRTIVRVPNGRLAEERIETFGAARSHSVRRGFERHLRYVAECAHNHSKRNRDAVASRAENLAGSSASARHWFWRFCNQAASTCVV